MIAVIRLLEAPQASTIDLHSFWGHLYLIVHNYKYYFLEVMEKCRNMIMINHVLYFH